jgi:hypothetical protein
VVIFLFLNLIAEKGDRRTRNFMKYKVFSVFVQQSNFKITMGCNVAWMIETRTVYRILAGKPL